MATEPDSAETIRLLEQVQAGDAQARDQLPGRPSAFVKWPEPGSLMKAWLTAWPSQAMGGSRHGRQ
jgi:hypothetical protein